MHSRKKTLASLHRLMLFAQWVKVRRMIESVAVSPKQTFWIMTMNLLLDAATIEWAKVFGSWKEDTHWTKIVPAQDHKSTRAALLKCLGLTQKQWEAYRDTIVDYRNQIVAHHDLSATLPAYPRYDKALDASNFMFDVLRGLADQNMLGGIPTSLDRWSNTVSANMRAIVRKAFAASAELGSNVP